MIKRVEMREVSDAFMKFFKDITEKKLESSRVKSD
jgi:hypothetical protein